MSSDATIEKGNGYRLISHAEVCTRSLSSPIDVMLVSNIPEIPYLALGHKHCDA